MPRLPSRIMYNDGNHAKILLNSLYNLRVGKEFCDVVIKVYNTEYSAHKCVLAGSIPYFQSMFRGNFVESNQTQIVVDDISSETMSLFLDFAYTSSISIDSRNVQDVIYAADFLGVTNVRDQAKMFLGQRINESNWLEVYNMPEYGNSSLKTAAYQYILKKFETVSQHVSFRSVTETQLMDIVTSDELCVSDEKEVFCAVMRWFNAQPNKTSINLKNIMDKIRLCLIDLSFLHTCTELFPVIEQLPEIKKLITDAEYYHLIPDSNLKKFKLQSTPRTNSNTLEIISVMLQSTKIVSTIFEVKMWPMQKCEKGYFSLKYEIPDFKNPKVVHLNHTPYVYGSVNTATNFLKYDFDAKKWLQLDSLTCPVRDSEIVTVKNYFYAVGGFYGDERSEDIKRFEDMEWKNIWKLKMPVTKPAVVTHNRVIYLIGGIDMNGKTCNVLQRYDCATNLVSFSSSMLKDRARAAACIYDDCIYVFGGVSQYFDEWGQLRTVYLDSVERYDTVNNRWELLTPMPCPRADAVAASKFSQICIFGGEYEAGKSCLNMEFYNAEDKLWQSQDVFVQKYKDHFKGCKNFTIFKVKKSIWEAQSS